MILCFEYKAFKAVILLSITIFKELIGIKTEMLALLISNPIEYITRTSLINLFESSLG